MGSRLAQAWLRVGSRPIERKFGGGCAEIGLVLVFGGASWGWPRMGLGLLYGGLKNGFGHGCV